jgi:hypothetical protein
MRQTVVTGGEALRKAPDVPLRGRACPGAFRVPAR